MVRTAAGRKPQSLQDQWDPGIQAEGKKPQGTFFFLTAVLFAEATEVSISWITRLFHWDLLFYALGWAILPNPLKFNDYKRIWENIVHIIS